MRNSFYGHVFTTIKCSNFEELLEAIETGAWFKTDDFDWYYKKIPYGGNGHNPLAENVFAARRLCVTSINTQFSCFCRIEKAESSQSKIYTGKELENKICEELRLWAVNINPKTLRAFSGKSFVSYLNAIPKEIYLKGNFANRMETALIQGFVQRMEAVSQDNADELDTIFALSKQAKELVKLNLKEKSKTQKDAENNTVQTFEEIKTKRIAEMLKGDKHEI